MPLLRSQRSTSQPTSQSSSVQNEILAHTSLPLRRSNRLGSKELNDAENTKGKLFSTAPSVRGRVINDNIANFQNKRNVKVSAITHQLDSVEEEPVAEVEDIQQERSFDKERTQNALEVAQFKKHGISRTSLDNISNLSGATAVTTFSAAEPSSWTDQSEFLLGELTELCQTSSDILGFLLSRTDTKSDVAALVEELTSPKRPLIARRLDRKSSILQMLVDDFIIEDSHYIDIDHVNQALFRTQSLEESGAPEIMHKANLAMMTMRIFKTQPFSEEGEKTVRKLSESFPRLFASSFTTAGTGLRSKEGAAELSSFVEKSSQAVLAIRTQLLISALHSSSHNEDWDPDTLLAEILLSVDQDDKTNTWLMADLGLLPKHYEKQVLNRVAEIRAFFLEDEPSLLRKEYVDFDGMAAEFSWTWFLHEMIEWIRYRNQEIDKLIARKGGLEEIVQTLSIEVEASRTPWYPKPPFRSFIPPDKLPPITSIPMTKENLGKLKERVGPRLSGQSASDLLLKDSMAPRSVPSNLRATSANVAENGQPLLDDGIRAATNNGSNDKAVRMSEKITQSKHRRAEEKPVNRKSRSPKRTFLDPQDNRQRVAFDDSQPTRESARPPHYSTHDPIAPAMEEDDDDVSEDAGFQDDCRGNSRKLPTREVGRTTRSARSSATQETAQVSRKRSRQKNRVRSNDDDETATPPRPGKRPQRPASEPSHDVEYEDVEAEEHPRLIRSPIATNYSEVNTQAKRRTATDTRGRKRQRRQPWTPEEVDALIYYIETYGCSWSLIQSRDFQNYDNILGERSQGDLKDKAKNMKFDYLKAGVPLPKHFDLVMLDRKFTDRLEDLGIDYDQEQVRRR